MSLWSYIHSVPNIKSLFEIIHFPNLVLLQSMLTFEMQNLVSLKSYRNIFSFSEGRIFLLFTHDFFCFNQRFFREMTNDVDWKTRSILPCSISLRKRSKQFFFSNTALLTNTNTDLVYNWKLVFYYSLLRTKCQNTLD